MVGEDGFGCDRVAHGWGAHHARDGVDGESNWIGRRGVVAHHARIARRWDWMRSDGKWVGGMWVRTSRVMDLIGDRMYVIRRGVGTHRAQHGRCVLGEEGFGCDWVAYESIDWMGERTLRVMDLMGDRIVMVSQVIVDVR